MSIDKTHVLIIAEAGVNHNGDEKLALRLIDAAVQAGADIVKFQTFTASAMVSSSASKARYQKQTTGTVESQLAMLRKLELRHEAFQYLAAHCAISNISFLSSPFDFPSIDLLADIGLEMFKIPSGEITNLPYLRKIGGLRKQVILSTGMSTLDEVADALTVLAQAGTPHSCVNLLHCTTEYPTPYDEVNLRAMATLRAAFPDVAGVGYSDHTNGIEIPIAAVAMGATAIEKHFTLDKTMLGPDHAVSLEPNELAAMCTAIRHIEVAMGDGVKCPSTSELKNRDVVRKSIVAACPVQAGEMLTENKLTTKRSGTGISPMLWDAIVGTRAGIDYAQDDVIVTDK